MAAAAGGVNNSGRGKTGRLRSGESPPGIKKIFPASLIKSEAKVPGEPDGASTIRSVWPTPHGTSRFSVTDIETDMERRLLKSGAGEGIRTLDPDLGKVVLYP